MVLRVENAAVKRLFTAKAGSKELLIYVVFFILYNVVNARLPTEIVLILFPDYELF